MSEYQEFTGKTVEEALRNARETFGVTGLNDLDFEILTAGSRGVLGMGAEPARIVAAPLRAGWRGTPTGCGRLRAAAGASAARGSRLRPRPFGGDRGDRAGRGFDRGRERSFGDRDRPWGRRRPARATIRGPAAATGRRIGPRTASSRTEAFRQPAEVPAPIRPGR